MVGTNATVDFLARRLSMAPRNIGIVRAISGEVLSGVLGGVLAEVLGEVLEAGLAAVLGRRGILALSFRETGRPHGGPVLTGGWMFTKTGGAAPSNLTSNLIAAHAGNLREAADYVAHRLAAVMARRRRDSSLRSHARSFASLRSHFA